MLAQKPAQPNGNGPQSHDDDRIPGIWRIAVALTWLENLIVVISAPLMTFVAILSVADAFMGGHFLDEVPHLNLLYAIALGIGIEGQFSGMVYTARKNEVNGQLGVWFYRFVAFILFCVGVTTGAVVGYMQVFNVPLPTALLALNIQPLWWNWGRTVVMFGLIALSAHTRYVKKVRLSVEDELAEIDRKARIAAAKTAAAKANVKGFAGVARGAFAGILGRPDEEETPATAEAFAAAVEEETVTPARPILAEPAPLNLGGFKGKWWDAPCYKAYILFAYGVNIHAETALRTVQEVGNNSRAPGKAGAPFIATVAKLKNYAKRLYGDPQSLGISPDMAGQYPE